MDRYIYPLMKKKGTFFVFYLTNILKNVCKFNFLFKCDLTGDLGVRYINLLFE